MSSSAGPPELPGFYWDPTTQRYFRLTPEARRKLERDKHAQRNAAGGRAGSQRRQSRGGRGNKRRREAGAQEQVAPPPAQVEPRPPRAGVAASLRHRETLGSSHTHGAGDRTMCHGRTVAMRRLSPCAHADPWPTDATVACHILRAGHFLTCGVDCRVVLGCVAPSRRPGMLPRGAAAPYPYHIKAYDSIGVHEPSAGTAVACNVVRDARDPEAHWATVLSRRETDAPCATLAAARARWDAHHGRWALELVPPSTGAPLRANKQPGFFRDSAAFASCGAGAEHAPVHVFLAGGTPRGGVVSLVDYPGVSALATWSMRRDAVCVDCTTCGRYFVTASQRGDVFLGDVRSPSLSTLPGVEPGSVITATHFLGAGAEPQGCLPQRVMVARRGGGIDVCDTRTGRRLAELAAGGSAPQSWQAPAVSPCGEFTASSEGVCVRVWSTAAGVRERQVRAVDLSGARAARDLDQASDSRMSLALTSGEQGGTPEMVVGGPGRQVTWCAVSGAQELAVHGMHGSRFGGV
ncbi:unnamed protein product [Pedinophyceae sp. YPF-701]|nr:unnamed protein product [Pedinophyceae sp. YPF-701]